jgi:hypothetical protein
VAALSVGCCSPLLSRIIAWLMLSGMIAFHRGPSRHVASLWIGISSRDFTDDGFLIPRERRAI